MSEPKLHDRDGNEIPIPAGVRIGTDTRLATTTAEFAEMDADSDSRPVMFIGLADEGWSPNIAIGDLSDFNYQIDPRQKNRLD